MVRVYSDEFDRLFKGKVILSTAIEEKLHKKHKVYKDELHDALGDPCKVVMRNMKEKGVVLGSSNGRVYDLLCETSDTRVMFVVARLFEDGNLYIITAYWAEPEEQIVYYKESEVICDE